MFFPTLIAVPILAGLVAGVFSGRRLVPVLISGICVALGIAAAVVMAFNADQRGENVSFGLVAGIACAALVWAGFALGRIGRGSVSMHEGPYTAANCGADLNDRRRASRPERKSPVVRGFRRAL